MAGGRRTRHDTRAKPRDIPAAAQHTCTQVYTCVHMYVMCTHVYICTHVSCVHMWTQYICTHVYTIHVYTSQATPQDKPRPRPCHGFVFHSNGSCIEVPTKKQQQQDICTQQLGCLPLTKCVNLPLFSTSCLCHCLTSPPPLPPPSLSHRRIRVGVLKVPPDPPGVCARTRVCAWWRWLGWGGVG